MIKLFNGTCKEEQILIHKKKDSTSIFPSTWKLNSKHPFCRGWGPV